MSAIAALLTWTNIRFLLEGLGLTLIISALAIACSIVLGAVISIMRGSSSRLLRGFAIAYVELFKNTPLLLWIMFTFFVAQLPPLPAAVLAFTLFTAASVAEIVRGGLASVPAGQYEAARSQGFSAPQMYLYIILPQALRNMVPALLSQFVTTIKDTSYLWGAMALQELMGRGMILMNSYNSTVQIFAIFGLMANLLTFYYAIQTGNASMATILQYLAPLFIVLGSVVRGQRPIRSDVLAFVIALVGVVLCITRGDFTHLAIPLVSLLWGIGSGITAAFYVVLPRKANETNPPLVVLGWGTMIAGILFNLYHPFWVNPPHVTVTLVGSVATVVLFGTAIPFGLLLEAIHFAPSDVVSIMDAVQPIVTTILSVIFFSLNLNWVEALGIVIVIIAIYILQRGRQRLAYRE